MAFIEPMHRNKPNITYLLLKATGYEVFCEIIIAPELEGLNTTVYIFGQARTPCITCLFVKFRILKMQIANTCFRGINIIYIYIFYDCHWHGHRIFMLSHNIRFSHMAALSMVS